MLVHKQGIFKNIPNNEYHLDDGYKSSTALKLLYNDPIFYFEKYVAKTRPNEQKDCYDVGNAFHTAILEPHLFDKEYTFFDGRRSGEKWKEFLSKNQEKIILGNKQQIEYEMLVASVKNNKVAMDILKDGEAETSFYISLEGLIPDSNETFPGKVRLDSLKGTYASDLKSTTGDLTGEKGLYMCRKVIADFDYDLSAAFYLKIVNEIFAQKAKQLKQKPRVIKTWYWIFASKTFKSCRVIKASPLMLENGTKKYLRAIEKLVEYTKANWKMPTFEDTIDEVDPLDYDNIVTSSEEKGVVTW